MPPSGERQQAEVGKEEERNMSVNALASSFELSLRILLMLDILADRAVDEEQIAAIDFIAMYAADFGILDENLHGYGAYRFSEYPARRKTVSEALKGLVLDGYVELRPDTGGYDFAITDKGRSLCARFNNGYASEYRIAIVAVSRAVDISDTREMTESINAHALSSLKGDRHG